ncbi:MAG: S8 family peptidase [Calothrix sp. MO_192.B10]|nr:S8 family peptidase [Calothrix sp. MO_192.B10]
MSVYRISGQVIDRETGFGIPGLRIEAWDKDLICDDLVGSTITDGLGNFKMTFDTSYLQELFSDRRPALFFKVFQDGELIKSTEDAIIWNASVETAPIRIEIDRPGVSVGYRPRIVVKFKDYVDLPYEDHAEKYIRQLHIGPFDRLAQEFPGITVKKLYRSLETEQIQTLMNQAVDQEPSASVPNLLRYFMVECPPNSDPESLVQHLVQWPAVQTAYFDPPGEDPFVDPTDDPRSPNQGYLDPAPNGIDAEFAWNAERPIEEGGLDLPGGDGAGQNVIDLERGWTLNHEDLTAKGGTLLHGTIRDGSRAHGTAVLGELCAVDNAIGCIGIVSNVASVNAVSYWGSNRPSAILAAIANLTYGDVLLLEAQVSVGGELLPIEVLDAEFDTIRLATMLGIIVVEAAGNGSNDLDIYTNADGDAILNRGSADFRDSGAIMVGAASSAIPHTRMGFSNYGSRIDCYAWGENVNTCSSNNAGSTTVYTATFSGTSSASPIVTGAALAVQGIAEANLGYRFSPFQMRLLLSDPATGTASHNPGVDRIGVMPNLRAIIEGDVLHLAPDIYLRDFVGDAGDPHIGSISASPDIILRPTTVADPQATYGEGSGTENSNTLGYKAEAGQDNYIYVRVRNRGGSPATNVVATVYWAEVSSLVTPDLWHLIGSTTLPLVTEGDILTVLPPITWAAADIPATGHYCFVGLVGTDTDPPPELGELLNWDNFRSFIRNNNNVTWRKLNVVDDLPDPSGYIPLPFIVPGLPELNQAIQLEVVARLPRGAHALLEQPRYLAQAMGELTPLLSAKEQTMMAKLPINPNLVRLPIHVHGIKRFREVVLSAKSRTQMKLLVHIPEAKRNYAYELSVRHLYQGEEMGRITWRIVPPKREG